MKDAVIQDRVQVNPEDKAMAKEGQFDLDSIWDMERINLNNLTGIITNINSSIQDSAFAKGDIKLEDLAISVCKLYQGIIIDSAKTGQVIKIPEILTKIWKRPYYFKYVYGDNGKEYIDPVSPLSRFCTGLEEKIDKLFPKETEDKIGTEKYLDIGDVTNLLIDERKFDSAIMNEMIEKLTPIHNDFSTRKGLIDDEFKQVNVKSKSDEDKEIRNLIRQKYKDLYEETKIKSIKVCNEICTNPIDAIANRRNEINEKLKELKEIYKNSEDEKLKEEIINEKTLLQDERKYLCNNPSILASACTEIGYRLSKISSKKNNIARNRSYTFSWIVCPEGLLENLKSKEDVEKTVVKSLNINGKILNNVKMFNVASDGTTLIDGKSHDTGLKEGRYPIFQKAGKFYVEIKENKEIAKVQISSVEKKNDYKLPKLDNYDCSLIHLKYKDEFRTGKEIADLLIDKDVIINLKDDQYPSIYLDGEFVASIAQGDWLNTVRENKYNIKDYVGKVFKVKENLKTYNKSLKVIMCEI